ncbi:MAG TPA: APC family permease [Vicinamibacterales bacterium]|nr:APC family permease [Vicinamibacterales bacterium]
MIHTTADQGRAVTPAASLEQFGYHQELKRSLSLFDLVVYGLVYINLVAPLTTFGIVFNASHGMVPLVYVVGAMAMALTASSYVTMSRVFPVAGSVYTYAGRGIGETAGFFAGWVILLDYVLLQAVGYVVTAVAIQSIVPDVPRGVWIVLLIAFNTTINLLGIEATARVNRLVLVLMFTTIGLFIAIALAGLSSGVAGARLSSTPFFTPSEFTPTLIFGALAIAMSAFLGFDAISTLAEEARGGSAIIGRATLLALGVASVVIVVESYLASLFALSRTSFPPGQPTDGAIYDIAVLIGGPAFRVFMVIGKVLVSGIGGVLLAQVATARILYGMARDGNLPRFLAHVHASRRVPDKAIIAVAAMNLVGGLAFANQMALVISLVNFGALTGFLLLHLSVIVHFLWRQQSRNWLAHLVVPLLGVAINGYVLLNLAVPAKVGGITWLATGVLVLMGLRLTGRRIVMPV